MPLQDELQQSLGTGFTIERELGGGGMSRVFVARETALRRDVVVKVLPPDLVAGVNVERFRREILTAASLQNPHIVPVLTAGEMDGVPWFTMPFVQGESLRARVARGPMPMGEVVNVLRDVAKALAYAHERGVVHRDIKPDNVLVSGGTAVVTDFGIAKALSASRTGEEHHQQDGTRGQLTQIGMSIGTPSYMAPEQAAADPNTDARADLYSFGCLAYELLAGHPPFVGLTPQRLLAAHMSERPRDILAVRPDTPPLLAQLVMQCLEKEPDKRPANASDVVRLIDAAVTASGSSTAAGAVLLGTRVRLRVALAMWAVVVLAAWLLAKAAIVGIGLPSWVLPGALIVAALGLPVILFTAYVQRAAHRALTRTPTLTPGGTPVGHGTMATIALHASPHVSWRRTVRGGVAAFGAFVAGVAIFMLLRALGIGPAGSLFAAGRLKETDKLVLADFRVKNGDTSLAPAVTEAVRTSIGESSVLSLVPAAAVGGALARMEKPVTTRLDAALARDVAVRLGAKAVIDGDVTPLGAGYIVTMRLVSADSGASLASFQETAAGPTDLLPTIDKLARRLRGKAGESLKAVQSNPPLADVTTTSLEALRLYAEGVRLHDVESHIDRAIVVLQQAVAIDSTFAMAYRKLFAAMSNAGYSADVAQAMLTRAYHFREHLPPHERQYVEAYYFANGDGRDRARGIALLEDLVRQAPNDPGVLITLARAYMSRGEIARADSVLARARRLAPDNAIVVANQIEAAELGGRAAIARDSARAFLARNPTGAASVLMMATALMNEGQWDSAARFAAKAKDLPGVHVVAIRTLAHVMQLQGKLSEEARMRAEANALDSARGGTPQRLADSLAAANDDAWLRGDRARAATRVQHALALYPLRSQPENDNRQDFVAAIVLARAGRPDLARAIVSQWDSGVRDTSLKRAFEPDREEALGEIALAENNPKAAIDQLRRSERERDGPVANCLGCRRAQLGYAFDRAGMLDSAIASFEQYIVSGDIDRPGLPSGGFGQYLAGSYKRLGELYEEKGDIAKAITNTQRFIDLWKNADPDLQPKVADAKARLARLLKSEKR